MEKPEMKQMFDMKCTSKAALATAITIGLGLSSPAMADDLNTSSITSSIHQVQANDAAILADEAKKLQLQQNVSPGLTSNATALPGGLQIQAIGSLGGPQVTQPSNDTCQMATPLDCNVTVQGSTANATFSNAGTCGTSHSAPEVWYELIGTGGEIEVNTCGDTFGFDTKLTVWTGSCESLVCVGGNDDSPCPASGLLSRVIFNSVEGQTYYVMVHGFSTAVGQFDLNVVCDDDEPKPEGCVGDVDGDGLVGPGDLLALVDCWGRVSAGCESADINDDGIVNWFDLLIVLGDWGCFDGPAPCGDPDAGDCCIANGTPNCDDLACCEAVCAQDSFCCEVEWDTLCASDANDICDICDVEDNDTCQTATPLECNVSVQGSTANATFTNAGTCGTTHTAPDVWYTVIGTGGPIEVNTCGATFGYDTKLTVWTGSCSNLQCVGGNDDAACPASGLLSRVTFNSVDGQTYYIMVHGFSTATGPFDLNVICMDPPEPFECPDGASDEGEPCGEDTNGGCNSDPSVFGSISCGETICGSSWAAGGTRDTDWYEIVTTETAEYTYCGFAEFAFVIGLVDTGGSGNCADATALNPFALGGAGQEVCVTTTLGPGTYWWFIAHQGFEGNPCGTGANGYYVSLTCVGTEPECGIPGTGSCCEAGDSPFCDDAECCNAVCDQDPFCCDSSWDSTCAASAQDICAVCIACGSEGTGNCCVANDTPFCDDAECCEAICAADPFCCDVNWDSLCAGAAQAQCEVCGAGVCGDGVCDPNEDCESCPEDCGECEVPENNTCGEALPIFLGDTDFDTTNATTDGPPNAGCQFDGQTYNDIYFSFVAPQTGSIFISTCNQAAYDTDLKFYASCALNNDMLACNDDFPGCAGFTSLIEAVDVIEGEEYILRIGGWAPASFGTGTVTIGYN
jgi:hypothetical protein